MVDRIPFDAGIDFAERTLCILLWYKEAPEPYRSVLMLLADCGIVDHGRAYDQQYRGASYKQLAAIAHRSSMAYQERQEFYKVAESIGLSERHAAHIFGRLSEKRAA